MKTIYLDCFAGIAGDMLIAALLDLGMDFTALQSGLATLGLDGYRLECKSVERRGIAARQFKVWLADAEADHLADAEYHETDLGRHHLHSSAQAPQDDADTDHLRLHAQADAAAGQTAEHAHPEHGRSLDEINALIRAADLPERARQRSLQAFRRLAEAEGRVHGQPPEQVHFHEVGAVDAILDIVGSMLALDLLGVERVVASPLHLGGGFVRSAHGLLPVPAPATAYLLAGAPVYTTSARGELVTPTGATLVMTAADEFGPLPPLKLERIGHGAGSRQREFPNVLRAYLGELWEPMTERTSRQPYPEQHRGRPGPAGYHQAAASVIEANIDDMNPQICEYVTERLLQAGALDVIWLPGQMKKSRPGLLLQVLSAPDTLDTLLAVIFTETTSIGARTYAVEKRMLQRQTHTVETPYGPVRVKLACLGEQIVNVTAEYEDCLTLARRLGLPLKTIQAAALAAWQSAL